MFEEPQKKLVQLHHAPKRPVDHLQALSLHCAHSCTNRAECLASHTRAADRGRKTLVHGDSTNETLKYIQVATTNSLANALTCLNRGLHVDRVRNAVDKRAVAVVIVVGSGGGGSSDVVVGHSCATVAKRVQFARFCDFVVRQQVRQELLQLELALLDRRRVKLIRFKQGFLGQLRRKASVTQTRASQTTNKLTNWQKAQRRKARAQLIVQGDKVAEAARDHCHSRAVVAPHFDLEDGEGL